MEPSGPTTTTSRTTHEPTETTTTKSKSQVLKKALPVGPEHVIAISFPTRSEHGKKGKKSLFNVSGGRLFPKLSRGQSPPPPEVAYPITNYDNAYSSLHMLDHVDRVFLDKYQENTDMASFSVVSDTGLRLFCAKIIYTNSDNAKSSVPTKSFIEKAITSVNILNAEGCTIVNGDCTRKDFTHEEISPTHHRFDDVIQWLERLEGPFIKYESGRCTCVPAPMTIFIGDEVIGKLESGNGSNHCSDSFYLSTALDDEDIIISSNGFCSCCNCQLCCFSSCCPHTFEIISASSSEDAQASVLGKMTTKWSNNKCKLLGLSFSSSMDVETKAMLLLTALYVNCLYFEDDSCFGRVGQIGHKVGFIWAASLVLIILLTGVLGVFLYLGGVFN